MVKLYKAAMTPEVFGWNAASNNQLLIAGHASYILNSISAYRTAQEQQPQTAKDIFFTPALKGPGGVGLVNGHAIMGYMVPNYSKNQDTAKEFLLALVSSYADACYQSELYNFPGWASTAPKLTEEGGWLDNDPFGSQPANKLAVLKNAEQWTVNVGYPGPTNAIMGDVFGSFTLPKMMARAAQGTAAKDAVAEAAKEVEAIATKWRQQGLVK
jgi:ABC-type glycerol-3-phosphate transport system substrate-binding protein